MRKILRLLLKKAMSCFYTSSQVEPLLSDAERVEAGEAGYAVPGETDGALLTHSLNPLALLTTFQAYLMGDAAESTQAPAAAVGTGLPEYQPLAGAESDNILGASSVSQPAVF